MISTPIFSRKITFVIVEDNAPLRQALESSLGLEYEVVASVADGAAGVDAVHQYQPDLVLLDISLPAMDGFDTAERITNKCSTARIIFFTNHAHRAYVDEAFRRGAAGYVIKGNFAELMNAIRVVLDGQRYWPAFYHRQAKV